MKSVRNAIVTTAMTALRMLFVSESAVFESPSTPPTPLFSIASRARSTMW